MIFSEMTRQKMQILFHFSKRPKGVLCIARNLVVNWQACAHQTRSRRIEEANIWLVVYKEENKADVLDTILQIQHE